MFLGLAEMCHLMVAIVGWIIGKKILEFPNQNVVSRIVVVMRK